MNCLRPGCAGDIADDGYCELCGFKAGSTIAVSGVQPQSVAGETQQTRLAVSTRTATTRRARRPDSIVEIPPVPPRDPTDAVLVDAQVPEEHRFCAVCDAPVGRSRDGSAGRTEGYCARCGERFSFRPTLVAGDLVAGQYEVAGPIARGGMGWIYLARDRNVADRWVVLKGLLNSGDEDARAAALAERAFLAEVTHPDIVKIYNFVEHGDDGYIVMEFVRGRSLSDILREWRDDYGEPLPVEHALWYMLQALPAFAYLHEIGLIYCDFKPENVMRTGNAIQLVDLGGAYRLDGTSSAIYGTRGYQAPEIAQTGPTVATDLYTVGRSLAVLCARFRISDYLDTLPLPADQPAFARFDSLYRLLERATAKNPDDRFQSADELAAQLMGVLREVVAANGKPSPGPSSVFTGELRAGGDAPHWRSLPALLVDTDDAGAGFLATVAAVDPADVIALLKNAPEQTTEVQLAHARALIDAERVDDAARILERIALADPWEWRVSWYRGLARLRAGDPIEAGRWFDLVYRHLPGELAPKLALALTAETAGDLEAASRWADIVSTTDPTYTSATFCLARCRSALHDRAGSIEALDRVPEHSSAYVDAQVGKVHEILRTDTPDEPAAVADVVEAARVLAALPLGLDQATRLSVVLLRAALTRLEHDGVNHDDTSVLGHRLNNRDIRAALEASYRSLARHAHTKGERVALVREANRSRPWTAL